jgi:hypothetical protein
MIKRMTAGFVAATVVGVVLCGANSASAIVFESFESGWDGSSATPAPGWSNAGSNLTATASADSNGPTDGALFMDYSDGYSGGAARYTAADDGGNDISAGFRFDVYMGNSDPGTGLYLQIADANHGNIAEVIVGATEVVIEGSGGKETSHTYPNGASGDWRTIDVIPDYNNHQFYVVVDGIQGASVNARAQLGGLTGFNMNFYAAWNAGVDNFRDVPEPASAALLGLGTALMMVRRRR